MSRKRKNKTLDRRIGFGYDAGKEKYTLIPLRTDLSADASASLFRADEPSWQTALRAAESKKASDCKVLDLREITSLADYFLICTATNQRQAQAIWDEIAKQSKEQRGEPALSVEGYSNAEWICGDFGDLIVHVFTAEKREFYDLERLWRHAKTVHVAE